MSDIAKICGQQTYGKKKQNFYRKNKKGGQSFIDYTKNLLFSALQLIFPLENLKKEFFIFKVD